MNKLASAWSMLIMISGGVLLTSAAAQRTHAQLAETETVSSADATHAPIAAPLKWTSSGVLVSPVSDESHTIVSVKDPTVLLRTSFQPRGVP